MKNTSFKAYFKIVIHRYLFLICSNLLSKFLIIIISSAVNKKDVKIFLKQNKVAIVVKADGLASGKGVVICHSKNDVEKFSNQIFLGKFKSSKKLILEEFLDGEEVSYFLIVDKKNFSFIGSAQDHKRVGENETGPNTGGMGAYSPAPIINNDLEKKIIKKIVKPTLNALKKKNHPYTGFLYVGLMIKKKRSLSN